MMNCQQCQPELSAYLDGEVTLELRGRIETHLGECDSCRQRLNALREMTVGIEALPRLQSTPEFLVEIREKIDRAGHRSWVSRLFLPIWPKVPLEALALVVLLGVVVGIYWPRSPRREPARQAVSATPVSGPLDDRMNEQDAREFDGFARGLQSAETESPRRDADEAGARQRVDLAKSVAEPATPSAPQSTTSPAAQRVLGDALETAEDRNAPVVRQEAEQAQTMDKIVGGVAPGDEAAMRKKSLKPESQPWVLVAATVADGRARLDQLATGWGGRVIGWDAATQVAEVELPARAAADLDQLLDVQSRDQAEESGGFAGKDLAAAGEKAKGDLKQTNVTVRVRIAQATE